MASPRETRYGLDFALERDRQRHFGARIAGVDEAGRGPWAGPVVAAAVILDPANLPEGIDDSKMLNRQARDVLAARIQQTALVGIGIADVARIDRDNILVATLWAMAEACSKLGVIPDLALVDGNRPPRLVCPVETIVRGDALVASIAAASIMAKVTRDQIMRDLAVAYPFYGFERHKGYGTQAHRAALAQFGPCPAHRLTFKPIRALLQAT